MGAVPPSLLTLDRGNTTLDCLLHGAEPRRARLAPGPGLLTAWLGGARPARCAAVTVVPSGLDQAEGELAALGVPVLLAGRDLPCPLPLDYRTPATLGADRWVAALAAHRAHGRAVVVDCGSACTVDLVELDGTFRGGSIAPGLRALAAGLAAVTPHLPAPDLQAAGEMPPRSSAAAVASGVVLGWCGALERLVADLLRAAGGPATVVLTGGDAEVYLRHGRLRPVHVPDLVHQGLRRLSEAPPCAC